MDAKELHFNKTKRFRRRKRSFSSRQRREVKQMIDANDEQEQELKFFDTTVNVSNSLTYTNFIDLMAVPQGIGISQRIGDFIKLKSVFLRLQLSVADTHNIQRIMLIQWKENDGTSSPSLMDVLQYKVNPIDIHSPLQIPVQSQYRVLWDQTFAQVPLNDSGVLTLETYINKGFISKIEYNEGQQTGINKLYLLYVSDSGVTPHPLIQGWMRTRFTDS